MYKEDLILNSLQWLVYHKRQSNQTKILGEVLSSSGDAVVVLSASLSEVMLKFSEPTLRLVYVILIA